MTNRLPVVSGADVARMLERAGFRRTHSTGSHFFYKRVDRPGLVTVPIHGNRDLKTGTLLSILRQAGLSRDEFVRLLRR